MELVAAVVAPVQDEDLALDVAREDRGVTSDLCGHNRLPMVVASA
jgi:hypothetical protein